MMSNWTLKLGIIIVFLLVTLQVMGKQDPVEAAKVGKALSADKVEIVYDIQGRGETAVIFIHGGFANRSFWRNQMKPFSPIDTANAHRLLFPHGPTRRRARTKPIHAQPLPTLKGGHSHETGHGSGSRASPGNREATLHWQSS